MSKLAVLINDELVFDFDREISFADEQLTFLKEEASIKESMGSIELFKIVRIQSNIISNALLNLETLFK